MSGCNRKNIELYYYYETPGFEKSYEASVDGDIILIKKVNSNLLDNPIKIHLDESEVSTLNHGNFNFFLDLSEDWDDVEEYFSIKINNEIYSLSLFSIPFDTLNTENSKTVNAITGIHKKIEENICECYSEYDCSNNQE
nr:hypothetical protein [uncultured Treponema sp.]